MFRTFAWLRLPALALLLAAFSNGCSDSGDDWNIELKATLSPNTTIERLDVVAFNYQQFADWKKKPVDIYWLDDDALRANSTRLTFEVVKGKIKLLKAESKIPDAATGLLGDGTDKLTILRNHTVWKQWLGQEEAVALVVIADYPGKSKNDDTDKRIVPLFAGCWKAKNRTLLIEIQDSGLAPKTPFSSKYNKIMVKHGLL
jgi:hypothetical protein